MHVDINEILQQDEGARIDFSVDNEQPEFEEISLHDPLRGQIMVVRTAEGVTVDGTIEANVTLECHRCLRSYQQLVRFPVRADYGERPAEDTLPIARDGSIDLAEAVRQELVVHLPQKQLCQEDCAGITI